MMHKKWHTFINYSVINLNYVLYYINKKFSGSRILRNPESAGARRVSRWLYSNIELTAIPYTGVFLVREVFVLTSEATVVDGILG